MNNKKYIIMIVVVIMLVLVGAVFMMFKKNTVQPQKNISNPVKQVGQVEPTEQAAVKIEEEKNKNIEVMKPLDDALDKTRLIDKDLDGLSDEQEKKLGTNPNLSDTDGDGISDGDEVNFYHTDPLKADTDGDSYKDGYEIRHGYDPLGPGKLKR